jgi:DUF2953 family protein
MILEIVAIVLLIFIILILAVLLIPFRIVLDASFSLETTSTNFALSWLSFTLWRSKSASSDNKPKKKPKEKKQEPKKKQSLARIFGMFSLFRDSLPAFTIILRSARRALSIRKIDLRLAFGSGDPAETAVVAGYLWGASWVLNRIPRVSVAFRPVFDCRKLNGTLNTDLKVRALPLVIGFLRAYLKKPFRRLIKEARSR